jgi:hypothetical protein
MNTDHLIDLLSTKLEPVSRTKFGTTLLVAMLMGGTTAFVAMLATVGPRVDLGSTAHLEWTAVKLSFAVSVILTAAPQLLKSMRPGLEKETRPALMLLPFAAAITTAFAILLFVTPGAWIVMLQGATSVSPRRCLLCITLFAAMPFAALVWALRQGAPTRLRLCGAIAGVVAGGFGAAAYALSCISDTIPFVAVCYGAAIALCAVIGAQLGPRFLRW